MIPNTNPQIRVLISAIEPEEDGQARKRDSWSVPIAAWDEDGHPLVVGIRGLLRADVHFRELEFTADDDAHWFVIGRNAGETA